MGAAPPPYITHLFTMHAWPLSQVGKSLVLISFGQLVHQEEPDWGGNKNLKPYKITIKKDSR